MIKAFLSDFDGTLVTKDILDVVCGIAGKEEESQKISEEFHAGIRKGISESIIPRINFLCGVTLEQIQTKLNENNYLLDGAQDLFSNLRKNDITTILHSGNILPVLEYYKNILGIDIVVGTKPKVENGVIKGITEADFPTSKEFKIIWIKKLLEKLKIRPEETVALGDAPSDRQIFEYTGTSIAINPKHGIEKYADYTVQNLREVFPIIEKLVK